MTIWYSMVWLYGMVDQNKGKNNLSPKSRHFWKDVIPNYSETTMQKPGMPPTNPTYPFMTETY